MVNDCDLTLGYCNLGCSTKLSDTMVNKPIELVDTIG